MINIVTFWKHLTGLEIQLEEPALQLMAAGKLWSKFTDTLSNWLLTFRNEFCFWMSKEHCALCLFFIRQCKNEVLLEMTKIFSTENTKQHKAGYTLIVFRVSTSLRTISWDCAPITIHFSQYRQFHSSLILRETWQEICHIVFFDILWKYRSPGKNGETQDEKNDWRGGLRNAIYTLPVSLISSTFFLVLVNLMIRV